MRRVLRVTNLSRNIVGGRGRDSRPVNVIAAILKCVPCADDIIEFEKIFIENGCDITVRCVYFRNGLK
jgi:hypothetical protein